VKIAPVDVQIIGLTEITRNIFKSKISKTHTPSSHCRATELISSRMFLLNFPYMYIFISPNHDFCATGRRRYRSLCLRQCRVKDGSHCARRVPVRRHVHSTRVYRALTRGSRSAPYLAQFLDRRQFSDHRPDPFITYIFIESRATQFPICCVAGGRCDRLKPFSATTRLCSMRLL